MNDRIKSLDKIAQEYASSVVGNDETSNYPEWFNVYKTNFAELIIRECAKIAKDCYEYHEPLSSVPIHIMKFDRLTDENMNTVRTHSQWNLK